MRFARLSNIGRNGASSAPQLLPLARAVKVPGDGLEAFDEEMLDSHIARTPRSKRRPRGGGAPSARSADRRARSLRPGIGDRCERRIDRGVSSPIGGAADAHKRASETSAARAASFVRARARIAARPSVSGRARPPPHADPRHRSPRSAARAGHREMHRRPEPPLRARRDTNLPRQREPRRERAVPTRRRTFRIAGRENAPPRAPWKSAR
jgi:hypothetical protein